VFALTAEPQRDLLMVAGGTGLAPIKAIVEQLAELHHPQRVHLFLGARRAEGLYDLPDLEKLATRWPWLTVVPALGGNLMSVVIPGNEGRLTPEQIRSATFPPARFGRRGLDEVHVRAFCAQVEEEVVFLLNERASLYQQAEQLRQRVHDPVDGEPAYMSSIAHLQAVQVLVNAQKTAERFVSEAQAYCRELAQNARDRRDALLTEARRGAAKMMERADQDARLAVAEAARAPVPAAAASASVAPASVAPASAAPASAGEQESLHGEIAYLRMYSQVYRTHLRTYLEALLRNVDEWARAEQSPPPGIEHKMPLP
jgi:DivIVA domain-containing protein